jgi:hypothetical protein
MTKKGLFRDFKKNLEQELTKKWLPMAKNIHCSGVLSKKIYVTDGKKILVRDFSVQNLVFQTFLDFSVVFHF